MPYRYLYIYCFISLFIFAQNSALATCTKPDCKYYKAEIAYNKLLKNPKFKNRRDKWLNCINQFKSVSENDPNGIWAPAGLYMTGLLYNNLYKYSHNNQDLDNATSYLKQASEFKKSRYSLEAIKLLRKLPVSEKTIPVKQIIKHKDVKTIATTKKKQINEEDVLIKDLRHGSLPSKTRIVIDTDKAVEFRYGLLKDPNQNNKNRLYIDLKKATLERSVRQEILLNDQRVESIRTAYNSPGVVRIAIDLKEYKDYKIFALRSPSRVVVDIWGEAFANDDAESPDNSDESSPSVSAIISSAGVELTKQLALGVKTIVIDPGHGGADYGAPGYTRGTHEKDIALTIAQKLAEKIKKQLQCEVIMTRDNDKFITLEERTRIANKNKADLFISIHTNASRTKKAYGIETYFLNLAKDRASVSVAARENATSEKNISDLQSILNSLMKNTKITESSKLAKDVQSCMYNNLKKKYSHIKNKGVKQAPFYVLLGARMPSILVETSFISNKRECNRLKTSEYQDQLCDAIVDGIEKYIKNTSL